MILKWFDRIYDFIVKFPFIFESNSPSSTTFYYCEKFMRSAPYRAFWFIFFYIIMIGFTVGLVIETRGFAVDLSEFNLRRTVTSQEYHAIVHPPDSRQEYYDLGGIRYVSIKTKHIHPAGNEEKIYIYYNQELTNKGWTQIDTIISKGYSKIATHRYKKDNFILTITPEIEKPWQGNPERIWTINIYYKRPPVTWRQLFSSTGVTGMADCEKTLLKS